MALHIQWLTGGETLLLSKTLLGRLARFWFRLAPRKYNFQQLWDWGW